MQRAGVRGIELQRTPIVLERAHRLVLLARDVAEPRIRAERLLILGCERGKTFARRVEFVLAQPRARKEQARETVIGPQAHCVIESLLGETECTLFEQCATKAQLDGGIVRLALRGARQKLRRVGGVAAREIDVAQPEQDHRILVVRATADAKPAFGGFDFSRTQMQMPDQRMRLHQVRIELDRALELRARVRLIGGLQ